MRWSLDQARNPLFPHARRLLDVMPEPILFNWPLFRCIFVRECQMVTRAEPATTPRQGGKASKSRVAIEQGLDRTIESPDCEGQGVSNSGRAWAQLLNPKPQP